MNDIKILIDVFGVIFEIVIIHYYFTYIMRQAVVSKKMFGVIYGISVIFMTFVTQIPNVQFYLLLINFSLIFFVSVLFRGKWNVKLFFSFLLIIMFALSEYIIGSIAVLITSVDIGEHQNNFFYYIIGLLASKILVFLFIKILGYKRLGIYKNIPLNVFLGLALTPISSIVAMYTIGINLHQYQGWTIMLIVLGASALMCVANFFVFYLFENQIRVEHTKIKLAFAEKQIEQQTDYYKELSQRQIEVRTLSHDMKHYLSGVLGIVREGNYDEAVRYLEKIGMLIQDTACKFDTGHPELDTVLHFKKQNMNALDIQFEASIALPKKIEIDVLDLCIILGNGLDNAIEACEKIKDADSRFIILNLNISSKYISVSIENSTDENISLNSFPKTSKSDFLNHGFGLESIKSITNKYDGSLNFEAVNNTFRLAAMIKNE